MITNILCMNISNFRVFICSKLVFLIYVTNPRNNICCDIDYIPVFDLDLGFTVLLLF